jgi:hypothetical protein
MRALEDTMNFTLCGLFLTLLATLCFVSFSVVTVKFFLSDYAVMLQVNFSSDLRFNYIYIYIYIYIYCIKAQLDNDRLLFSAIRSNACQVSKRNGVHKGDFTFLRHLNFLPVAFL